MNNKRLSSIRIQKSYHILPVKPGQLLELYEKVGEGSNARIWKFKGLVIKVKKPNHVDGTFTIRGKAAGHTIEKIYPLSFNQFEKVLLLDFYKIRRAKLYYVRDKVGKDARMKSISTGSERGIDLLALSLEEVEALHGTYLEETQQEETQQEETQQEEAQQEEAQQEETQQEEAQQEETQQEETQQEETQQEETQQEETQQEEA